MGPEEGHLAKTAWAAIVKENPAAQGNPCRDTRCVEEAAEAGRSTRGGREATGPEKEGPRPTPSLARGIHPEASPEATTTECGTLPDFRADRPTKG